MISIEIDYKQNNFAYDTEWSKDKYNAIGIVVLAKL